MSTFLLGDQSTGYTIGEGFSVGEIFAWEFSAEESGWLETLEVLTNAVTPTATSLALGIYADASGTPGALLGEAVHAGKPSVSTWTAATLATRVQIFKGTKYWLATLPLGGGFEANLTTEKGSDRHQVGSGNTVLKTGSWEEAHKTSLGLRGMGTAQSFANFPKFRGTSVPLATGPKNATTSMTLTLPTGESAIKAGDLIIVQVQGTTNEARWPKLSIVASGITWHLAGEEGKDLESGGQQTCAQFYGIAIETLFGIEVKSNESCTLNATIVAIQKGTFNASEPVKAAGYRESTTEGVCPTPAVTGLTATTEYLALALFGYKSGKVKELTGWTADAMEGKYGQLHREWTGITTTGEPAFTKSGAPRAMTMMLLVQPLAGKSVTLEASDNLSVAESASRLTASTRAASESVGVAESTSRVQAAPRTSSDSWSIADTPTRTVTSVRSVTDTLTVAETITRVAGALRQTSDAVAVAELAARVAFAPRAAAESLVIADSGARTAQQARAGVDVLLISDAATRTQTDARVGADGVAFSESSTVVHGVTRLSSDAVAVSESASRSSVSARTAADTLSVLDIAVIHRSTTRAAGDGLTVLESAEVIIVVGRPGVVLLEDDFVAIAELSDNAAAIVSLADEALAVTSLSDAPIDP